MNKDRVNNVNIVSEKVLPTPAEVKGRLPLPPELAERVLGFRGSVRDILDGRDGRLLAIVGPCSIHNVHAALAYANRLHALARDVEDVMLLMMRVYFEKPRTATGWKGFINDPYMDDSFRIDEGLHRARELLLTLARMGLPAATEALDPIVPQYIADLITWTAIGARTTESQTHRQMASGLSSPVGFKNGTDGNVQVAADAIRATRHSHHFLGITNAGQTAVFHTGGNPYAHIVLRGGTGPNYDAPGIAACERVLSEAGLPAKIVVDCSHANSGKDPERQPAVLREVIDQVCAGNRAIVGVMIESNIAGGSQPIPRDLTELDPNVSVTDPCLAWDDTQRALDEAGRRLREGGGRGQDEGEQE